MNKLIENIFSLSILQIFNIILPLLTYPYVLRVLGSEIFGNIVYAQTVMSFLAILVSFGFGLSASKLVSIHRSNAQKLNEIVSSVTIVKSAIFSALFILVVPVIYFSTTVYYKWLYILSFWVVIHEVVFPSYFFQGIEEMKIITIINFLVKLIFVLLIFVFIQTKEDFLLYPLFNFVCTLIAGIISFYVIRVKYTIRFCYAGLKVIKLYLLESLPLFLSNISAQIYVYSSKIFLGNFIGMAEVAHYDLAEKIIGIFKMPQGIISQVLFPRVSLTKDTIFFKRILLFSFIGNVTLYLVLYMVSQPLILFLGGSEMLDSMSVVLLLGLTIPIVALSNVLGTLIMIPLGLNKLFSKAIGFASVFFISLLGVLYVFGAIEVNALCIVIVLTEVFVCMFMFYYLYNFGLWEQRSTTI